MFSHTSLQPQVFCALSQFSSLLNSVRSTSHGAISTKRQRKYNQSHQVAPPVAHKVSPAGFPEVTNPGEGLDFSSLCPHVTIADLCPLMDSTRRVPTRNQSSHWTNSYMSARSFFENKTGFSESSLWQKGFAVDTAALLRNKQFVRFLDTTVNRIVVQQRRGFQTHRAGTKTGIGKDKAESSVLEDLKKSVFHRIFPEKKLEKLHHLVSQHAHQPEFQEKIKVAFAEGYHAREKREADPKQTLFSRLMRVFFYMLLLWLVVQLVQVYSAMGGTGVRGLGVLNREQFEINPEDIHVTFEDVMGADEAKQELQDVVEFLRDPEKFTSLGAKLPNGVLLVGPPGIGKTLLARAVAGEAGVPFFHASGSEFDEIFVGTGAKRVRQMFKAAKMRAPCLIFIDEIDSVGAKRTSSQIHPYANQTINQLLSEMDGFTQNEGVIVLGATNRRDNLDKALLRPGRFDVEVRVYPPDLKGRIEILQLYMKKVKAEADVDVEKLARGTTGFTGADLENLVNQAALKAAMDGDAGVSTIHLEFARDKVLMGPAKKSKIPDEETNQLTAYHEAGHTLVAYYTKDSTPLHKVTIIPRGMSLGHTSFIDEKEVYNRTKAQLLAEMDVCMGGRAAEEIVYGTEKVTTGASSDFQQATGIASAMVKRFGMSEKVGVRVLDDQDPFDSGLSMLKVNELSPATQELVDNEIKRLLQESYDRAKQLLRAHSAEHKHLAKELLKHETLDKEEIKALIEGKALNKT